MKHQIVALIRLLSVAACASIIGCAPAVVEAPAVGEATCATETTEATLPVCGPGHVILVKCAGPRENLDPGVCRAADADGLLWCCE